MTHDLIVIGAGAGGLGCAGFGSTIGLDVALIDKTEFAFGGDCLNNGCVPSKALLHVASLFAGGKQAEAFGLKTEGKANFARVIEYIHKRQNVIRPLESPEHFGDKYGTDCIIGEARLTGKREVTVNSRKLSAPRIVLATGSVPRKLDLPGTEAVKQWDNESVFWELKELPEHLLIVGGGPISCELAQAFVRLGSRVTLLVRGERLLVKDPLIMGRILTEKLLGEGVDIRFETEIASFRGATTAVLKGKHTGGTPSPEGRAGGEDGGAAGAMEGTKSGGGEPTMSFSHLLVAIGRNVLTEGLGLAAAGVETKDGKIVTDDRYRTTNPYIYAIGDAFGREQFSHGAEFHNTQLWNNLLSPLKKKHKLDRFTWVTFTDPEIASFGMTPQRLKERGIAFETRELPLEDDDRAVAADYRYGHLIVYLSKGYFGVGFFGGGKVLGGCLAAPAAGEMIQELHFLQQQGMQYGKLTNKIYAYPVGSRIVQQGARQGTTEMLRSGWVPKILRGVYRLFNR